MKNMQNNIPNRPTGDDPQAGDPNRESPSAAGSFPWIDKRIIIGVIALAVILLIAGCGSETTSQAPLQESDEAPRLSMVSAPFPPYNYVENGENKGILFDLMDRVMTNLEIPYDFELFPFGRSFKLTADGTADGFLALGYNPEWESLFHFTPEQVEIAKAVVAGGKPPTEAHIGTSPWMFFIRTIHADSVTFESPEQIAQENYRVGINTDYPYPPAISESGWNFVEYIDEPSSIDALGKGEIDMFITTKEIGLVLRKEKGLQDEITFIEKPIVNQVGFIVFSKASDYPNLDELQRRVDEELIRIHQSGEFQEIYDSYTR